MMRFMIAAPTMHTDTSQSGAEPVTYVTGRNSLAPGGVFLWVTRC